MGEGVFLRAVQPHISLIHFHHCLISGNRDEKVTDDTTFEPSELTEDFRVNPVDIKVPRSADTIVGYATPSGKLLFILRRYQRKLILVYRSNNIFIQLIIH